MKPNSPTNINRNHMSNPFQKFVNILDNFQHRKNMTLQDSVQLMDATNEHYQIHYSHYYNPNSPNLNSSNMMSMISPNGLCINPYLAWQQQHEIFKFDPLEAIKISTTPNMTYCNIDAALNSIRDILSLLEKHPYAEDTEYNIDLKALHNIKPELQTFDSMIGNDTFKRSILRQLLYFLQQFDDSKNDYKHMVITGPPGTGKTEMAKIIGKMYSKLGILKKNIFKKVTRSELVAGYLGQTAIKTKKVVEECLGGVLFFDEAYSFAPDESYSKECIDTLCECLSDNRNNFMMIIAGYEEELENTFFKINSGMKSRFIWRFDIEKYSIEELMQIFIKFVNENNWKCDENINLKWFSSKKDHFLYNGRDMELLFSYVKIAHAQRVFGKPDNLKKIITHEDMCKGFEIFEENKKSKKKENLFSLYI